MQPSYIIDCEKLLQRFMGDRQVAREMLGCFCNSIPVLISTLKGHVASSDQDAILTTVQKILRIVTRSCAVTVQECAFQMGHAVIREDMATVQEIMPLLELFSVEVIEAVSADNYLLCWNQTEMA